MHRLALFLAGLLLALASAPAVAAVEADQEIAVSYPAARDSLVERIRLVEPDFDPELPFRALADLSTGPTLDLEQVVDDVTRLFEVRGGLLVDDGVSGWADDRWRTSLTLRVRYPAGDPHRVEAQIGRDIPRLVHALIHPALPIPWHPAIESVVPPGPPTLTDLRGQDGVVLARLLELRFDVILRDAG